MYSNAFGKIVTKASGEFEMQQLFSGGHSFGFLAAKSRFLASQAERLIGL